MSRASSPDGTDFLREPRENADDQARLNCLLLNIFQLPTRLFNPDHMGEGAGDGTWQSVASYNRNSSEVRRVGLRQHPYIESVEVGVRIDKGNRGASAAFTITSEASLWLIDGAAGPEYEARFEFGWEIDPMSDNAVLYEHFSDNLSWDAVLEVARRVAKLRYNMFGEERTMQEATVVASILGPIFLGMPREGLSLIQT